MYLPWVVFAWLYYGSPVPLPISAKESLETALYYPDLASIWSSLIGLLPLVYLPPYAQAGDWSAFRPVSTLLCVIAARYWLHPRGDRLARQSSFVTFGGLVYLFAIRQHWPWYLPIVFLFSLPVWWALLGSVERRRRLIRPPLRRGVIGAGATVMVVFAFLAADYARVARETTSINERSQRKQIGLWLREVAEPDDTGIERALGSPVKARVPLRRTDGGRVENRRERRACPSPASRESCSYRLSTKCVISWRSDRSSETT